MKMLHSEIPIRGAICATGHDGRLLLASGIGPNSEGATAIVAFAPSESAQPSRLASDPELSPLDLAIAPRGNNVVSSEHPFGASDAVTTAIERPYLTESTEPLIPSRNNR
jgi:hypothetical protein